MQRLLEGLGSLAVGRSRVRKPTRLHPIADSLARTACLSEVVGYDLGQAFGVGFARGCPSRERILRFSRPSDEK
jgi:hypothetical protein